MQMKGCVWLIFLFPSRILEFLHYDLSEASKNSFMLLVIRFILRRAAERGLQMEMGQSRIFFCLIQRPGPL